MDAGQAFEEYSSYVQDAAKNSTVFGRAVTTLTGAAKSFGATLFNIGVAFAATWAITEVVNLIDDAIHRSERLIEAGKEARQAAQEIYSAYTGKQSSVSDLASGLFDDRSFENFYDSLEAIAQKYAELRTGVNPLTGENISLSVEQYQQYLDINNQLASLFPSLISGTTAQGDTLVDLGNNAAEATTKLQELMDAQRAMSYFNQREQMPDIIAGFEEQYNNYKEDLADLEKEQQDLLDLMNTINSASIDFEDGILTFPTALSEANPELVKDIQDILPQYTASIDGDNYVIKFDKDKITDDIETQLTDALDAGKAEALNNLDTDYYDLNVQMDNTKAELKTAVQDTMSTIADTFATNKTIANLPSDIQNMFLSGLKDENFIESLMAREDFNADTLMQDLEQRLVVPLDNISEEASESLSNLFEVDPSDLSLQEYSTQIQKVLGDAFGKDWGTFYDLFGFDEYFKEYGNMSATLAKQFEQDKESIYDMSAGDLEIAYDLVVNDGFTGTLNELQVRVDRIKNETAEIEPITFESLFKDEAGEETDLSKNITSLKDDISTIQAALDNLNLGEEIDVSSLLEQFPELSGQVDELDKSLSDLKSEKYGDIFSSILGSLTDVDDVSDEFIEQIQEYLNAILSSADTSDIDLSKIKNAVLSELLPTADDVIARQSMTDWVNNFFSGINIDTSRLEQQKNLVDSFLQSITSVNEAINSQTTGTSITSEAFSSKELEDYTSALEYHNGALQLNADRVKEITKAKGDEIIAQNELNKAQAQAEYRENAREIESLRESIENADHSSQTYKDTMEQISNLSLKNDSIVDQCAQWDLLNQSIREATGEYQAWLDAQNAPESGDMFDDMKDMWQSVREVSDVDSKNFGKVGNEIYQAAVDFIVPDSIDKTDMNAVDDYLDSINKYFTFDDGALVGMDLAQFMQDSADLGLMYLDEASGEYKIAGEKSMQEFADGLGLSLPVVQAIFGELEEYLPKGSELNFESGEKTFGDMMIAATEAADSLKSLDQYKNLDIQLDVSDLSTPEEQINALKNTIEEMQGIKAKPGVDTSEIENADSIIEYCVTQMQMLNAPVVMSVDTSIVQGQVGEAVSLLQQFTQAQNELEMQASLGIDTSEAQSNVDSIVSQLQSQNPQIMATLEVDTTDADSIASSLQSMNPEILVKAGIDETAIIGYTPSDKEATVKFEKDSSEPDSYEPSDKHATVIYNVNHSAVDLYNPQNLTRTVTYNVQTSGSPPSGGTNSASGTAHVSGTANNSLAIVHNYGRAALTGDWGTKRAGKTLVGELGREIVVDPHTGRWYTVGDNGAEFVDIPQNAIVFNHIQSQSLLEQGWVAARGTTLARGTALVNGRDTISGGGWNVNVVNKVSSGSSSSSSSTPSYSAPVTSNKSAKQTVKNNKEVAESFDWIARRIALVERYIDRLDLRASSAYRDFSKRNTDLGRQIDKINRQIAYEEKAYKRYMKEAESVGLSTRYEKLVQKGTIDIEKIKDEDLIEKINEYQKWWDLSREEFDKIQELEENLGDAYSSAFDMVMTEFDGILSEFEHKNTLLEGYIDQAEALGYMANEKYYEALKNVENQNLSALQQERNELISSLESAVNAGAIKQGSEAWNDMQSEINGVTEAIQESQNAIIEYNNEIRQIQWDRFDYLRDSISRITDEADFLIDLMSNDKLFGDKGEFSNEGFATLGLRGQNYNTYMEQSLAYAKEIQKIEAEMAKNPYDTNLIERRNELLDQQYDMILAAEDEKDAIVDLVEEGINLHLDALQELIDKYTEALDRQKNLYNFQNQVKDQTSEIASLEKQMLAWQGDTSEEGRSRMQQTQAALEEARQNLEETQYERQIEEINMILSDMFNDYSDFLNSKLENTDQLITDVIAKINESGNQISDTLKSESSKVGYTISDSLSQVWSSTSSILASYVNGVNVPLTGIKTVLDTISVNVANLLLGSSQQAQTSVSKAENSPAGIDSAVLSIINSEKAISSYKSPGHSDLFKYIFENYGRTSTNETYVKLANALGVSLPNGMTKKKKDEILKVLKAKGYRSGGYIRKDEIAWTQEGGNPEAIIRPDGSILMPLTGGTYVVNADATKNLFDLANDPQRHIADMIKDNSTVMPNSIGMSGTVQNSVDLTVNLPNVTNYDEFVTRMQHDNKIQKMFQDMTVGQLAGKGSFARMKYKFNK